jgi:hypothetical protein
VLPEGVPALPGKVRLWPYQRGVADAIYDPAIERVSPSLCWRTRRLNRYYSLTKERVVGWPINTRVHASVTVWAQSNYVRRVVGAPIAYTSKVMWL